MTEEQYKNLTEAEQQVCDLCRDWNLGDCESCELMKRGDNKMKKFIYVETVYGSGLFVNVDNISYVDTNTHIIALVDGKEIEMSIEVCYDICDQISRR